MANLSFLKLEDEDSCLLCRTSFQKNDTVNSFTDKGWSSLINNASKWQNIKVPVGHEYYMFPSVYKSIKEEIKAFGRAHEKCRITFSSKSNQYKKKYGECDGTAEEKKLHQSMMTKSLRLLNLTQELPTPHQSAKDVSFVQKRGIVTDIPIILEG